MSKYQPIDVEGGHLHKKRRSSAFIGTGKRRTIILGAAFITASLLFSAFSNNRVPSHQTTPTPLPGPKFRASPPELSQGTHYEQPQRVSQDDVLSDYSHGGDVRYPPTWRKMEKYEAALPQHNPDLPYPEGRAGRYVYFSNQLRWLGWNNVYSELLLNTHLAYESKRAYVFIDFWWNQEHNLWYKDRSKWPDPKAEYWHPHTPLNAIISGPPSGMPWDEGVNAPRSVHYNYWKEVCSDEETRVINTRDVKPGLQGANGTVIFDTWKTLLSEAPERCIEIQAADGEEDSTPQVFDLWLWGTDRLLSLWDSFSNSPTARLTKASPVVLSAVDRNDYIFLPVGPKPPGNRVSRDPYDRMMAMHVRRGDFKDACLSLARWNSTFYGWNLTPSLPDIFYGPPPQPGYNEAGINSPGNTEKFLTHCLPDKEAIRNKAHQAREDYIRTGRSKGEERILDVMYLLTNDKTKWMDELVAELRNDGWSTIRSSNDLELDQAQMDVSMAVDMEIARRAAVFIGNGWSSFTSNINFRRLMERREPISMRFW